MKVDRPRRAAGSIRILALLKDVVIREDVVAHQPARLALACHIRQPRELGVRELRLARSDVLNVIPVRIRNQHRIVAHRLEVLELVAVHPRFPVPVAPKRIVDRLLVEPDHPRLIGEG